MKGGPSDYVRSEINLSLADLDPIPDANVDRIWDGIGTYDPYGAGQVDPVAVARIILRKHWDMARCFCPFCVVARAYLNHRKLRPE